MTEVTKRWDFIYTNKVDPNKIRTKVLITGITIGVLAGSIITAFLLMTYSVFFL